MDDNRTLKDIVEDTLLLDTTLADYPIDAVDNNGIVTLQGEVPTQELYEAAERVTRQINGVVTVINELVVNGNVPKTTRPRTIIQR